MFSVGRNNFQSCGLNVGGGQGFTLVHIWLTDCAFYDINVILLRNDEMISSGLNLLCTTTIVILILDQNKEETWGLFHKTKIRD